MVGPADQIDDVASALGIEAHANAVHYDEREILYRLDLAKLVVPAALASGTVHPRPLEAKDVETAVRWSIGYHLESLGTAETDALKAKVARQADANVGSPDFLVLEHEGRLDASTQVGKKRRGTDRRTHLVRPRPWHRARGRGAREGAGPRLPGNQRPRWATVVDAMRPGASGIETIGCRAAMVLTVTLAAPACTDRGVQVTGQSDGEDGTTSGDATNEQDTNSDGRGTDESGGAADSTGGPSATTSSSGGDDSSGSTGTPDDVCKDGRVQAPCGPAAMPCSVVADELIDETPRTEYWAPVIAASVDCDPQVHYTTFGSPMNGLLARRDEDGTWSSEPTPFAWGRQLERDPDGQASVAIGGEDNPELWAWDGDWVLEASAPGDSPWWATGSGPDGTMYLAARDMDVLELHTWAPEMPGIFTTTILDEGPTSSLGLGGGATATVAWWSGSEDGWTLQSSDGSGRPEVIDTAFPGIAIAVADGGAHVLYTASAGLGAPTEVRYARRQPSGMWSVDMLIADDPDGVTCAQTMPSDSSDTCDYDYTRVRVQDIVTTDDGDVRMLFTEDHLVGQAVASTDCPGPGASPIPLPLWWCPEGSITTRLFVGWPESGGGVAFESVSEDHRLRTLDADLDAGGGINIAALISDEDDNAGTSVRYMRLR